MSMTLTELIKWLAEMAANEGDLKVYMEDMNDPELELCETLEEGDFRLYGKKYVFIKKKGD